MRSRRVKGPKKLAKIVVRLQMLRKSKSSSGSKSLLGQSCIKERGIAFEALSPEGDLVLLHAEENRANLQRVTAAPEFEKQEDFIGLSQFEIETVRNSCA